MPNPSKCARPLTAMYRPRCSPPSRFNFIHGMTLYCRGCGGVCPQFHRLLTCPPFRDMSLLFTSVLYAIISYLKRGSVSGSVAALCACASKPILSDWSTRIGWLLVWWLISRTLLLPRRCFSQRLRHFGFLLYPMRCPTSGTVCHPCSARAS